MLNKEKTAKSEYLYNQQSTGILVLEDGTTFRGFGLGAESHAVGEVCFNTSMTGYQEIITDPSYSDQIINFTFPHIGNVGTNLEDIESDKIWLKGVIFGKEITDPSNYRSLENLNVWLKKSNKWSKENIQLAAKERGVNPKRIIFAEKLPIEKHLASYKLADIFIDTFSYNAHTTATEALWAGLPVITKIGKGFAARVAGSLLSALDLKELITASEIEYENLIKKLASDPIELNKIKQKLDRNKLSSPLFNSTEYTLHLENAFVKIYKNYFKGENPKNIDVISNEANDV